MARLAERELERLKREVAVGRLAAARGVELRRHGADLLGLCPFHDDHTPSLVSTPGKNLCHCLGACRAGGGPIDWVMRAEGVSFRHAVELLQSGYSPGGAGAAVKRSSVARLASPVAAGDYAAALTQMAEFYHAALKQGPEADPKPKNWTKQSWREWPCGPPPIFVPGEIRFDLGVTKKNVMGEISWRGTPRGCTVCRLA